MDSVRLYNVRIIIIEAWNYKNSKQPHYEVMAPSLTLCLWVIQKTAMTRSSDLLSYSLRGSTLKDALYMTLFTSDGIYNKLMMVD